MEADERQRVVIAIGGNALSPAGGPAEIATQFRHTRESLTPIMEFARRRWDIAIVHGNGPQVGDALLRNEMARALVDELPLGVLVAGTAGWIGYMIQQSLQNALAQAGIERNVVTVITQVLVDPDHPSTLQPRKFVGRTVGPDVARELEAEGAVLRPDGGGELRRVVPSPDPVDIVEAEVVRGLVEAGTIVIAAGGGGTPVYRDPVLGLEGLDSVIDKDLAAAILAIKIDASTLLILTDVDGVFRAFGTPEQELISQLTPEEGQALLASGELGEGSMHPKLKAAVEFVEQGGGRAIIAGLHQAPAAPDGLAGTTVKPSTTEAEPTQS
ncbi:MAG: carbamate kinase [Gemmatimonadota bacterium]